MEIFNSHKPFFNNNDINIISFFKMMYDATSNHKFNDNFYLTYYNDFIKELNDHKKLYETKKQG